LDARQTAIDAPKRDRDGWNPNCPREGSAGDAPPAPATHFTPTLQKPMPGTTPFTLFDPVAKPDLLRRFPLIGSNGVIK
jgi:hypothetical protein